MHTLNIARTCLIAVALALPAGAARADEAFDLLKKAVDALPTASAQAKVRLTVEKLPPRELNLSRKFLNEKIHASYLEVVAPDELEGMRFLFLERPTGEHEQYIKVKASRTHVRVADEVRKQPFLGSAFYISDLLVPSLYDYTYAMAGEMEILGRRCKTVIATPKQPKDAVYGKSILAIDPNDLLILGRQFFDHKGELVKVWKVEKVERIDGIWTLLEQQMKDLKQNTSAKLEVTEVRYNVELPDSMFLPKYLQR